MNHADELTNVFKALGHPLRRQILDLLKDGPKTTGELDEKFADVTRYAVMKHLEMLVKANLVLVRREGRNRLNYLNAVPLRQMYDRWVNRYESDMAASLVNLKMAAEEKERENLMMNEAKNIIENSSFQIEQEIVINAPRQRVFEALTKDIHLWWAYRLGGEGSKLSFEPVVGGRFLETWGDNEGALWGTVYYINAPKEIRLIGHLGMKGAVTSAYTYQLEESGSSTIIKLSHSATGLIEPNWREEHSHGWQELLGKFLKLYVESGILPNGDKA